MIYLQTGLAYFNQRIIDQSLIHVATKTPYVLDWLLTVANITAEQVIDDQFVFADILYVPEQGRCTKNFLVNKSLLFSPEFFYVF